MINKFVLVGKVSVLSKDNPDYPGFYITALDGEEKVIPISLRKNQDLVQLSILDQLENGMTVGVNGVIDMTMAGIKLRAEQITIISRN